MNPQVRSGNGGNVGTVPVLHVSRWFNTAGPVTLESLRGRVVLIHAFQMLCPGCVAHGTPQVVKVHQTFSAEQVAVIGLHTVFEHHEVMGPAALEVFIHEYRLRFAIGVDAPGVPGPIPQTMAALGLQGTPSLLLLDRQGRVRFEHFGAIDDMAFGAVIGQLISTPDAAESSRR